jgi:VWFA-related protein
MKRFLALSLCLVLGFFLNPHHAARLDAGPKQGQDALQHEVTVTLKLVHVYVTDKRGNPVSDLGKDEFTLYDNGHLTAITEFEKHTLSLPEAPAPAPATKLPEAPPSPPIMLMNRKFFFLFDLVFTEGKGFRIAREAALRFLETGLLPEDEAAVLLFSGGRSLDVRRFLTRDHGAVRAAIDSLSIRDLLDRTLPDSETPSPVRMSVPETAGAILVSGVGGRGASASRILTGNFVWAMNSLALALRYVPGKKQVILYSKGILGDFLGRGEAVGSFTDLGRGFADMCKELAAANVSVFPVNTKDPTPERESMTGAAALREMASTTGGRFLGYAVNAEKHMQTVNALTGMYYVLGYPIGQTWDGKFHTIRVKVSRPGCEVHAQPGYFNPKPFSEYSKLEKQIHLVDLALAGKPLSQEPVRFGMQALPVGCIPPDNLYCVAHVPLDELQGVAGKRTEIVSLAFNALDEIVDSRRTEVDLTAGSREKSRAVLLTALSAPPGTYKCRVVLRNLETGRAAVAGSTGVVPERKPGKLLVLPPLLLTEAAGTPYLEGSTVTQEARPPAGAQAAKVFLFDRTKYEPYLEDSLKAGAPTYAAVRCVADEDRASRLALRANLTSEANGAESAAPLTVIAEKPVKGVQAVFVRLEIPTVEPGRYVLTFWATDKMSGQVSRVARSYVVN